MSQSQERIAASIGVPVARRHIFLCCDQTKPKCCDKDRGLAAWDYLKRRLIELGLSEQGGILRSKSNCLRICEGGPIAVVYPEGAWYRDDGEPAHQAGFKIDVVDSTGAGDTFNAALAVFLHEGLPTAVRKACAAAALSVSKLGAQGGMPRLHELDAWLATMG